MGYQILWEFSMTLFSIVRFTNTLIVTVFLLSLMSCKSSSNDNEQETQIPLAPNFLFAITHDNYAWGESHTNVYIESDGNIYLSVNNPAIDSILEENQWYPAADLHQRFEFEPTVINEISPDELGNMFELVSQVNPAQMSEPSYICADFGVTRFWGFIFDTSTNQYRTVLLAERGDRSRFNGGQESVTLTNWLAEVATDSPLALNICY